MNVSLRLEELEQIVAPAVFIHTDPRVDDGPAALGGNPTTFSINLNPYAFAVPTHEDEGETIRFTSIEPFGNNVAGFRVELGQDGNVYAGAAETGSGFAVVEIASSFGGTEDAIWQVNFVKPASPPPPVSPPPATPPVVPPPAVPPSVPPPPAIPPVVPTPSQPEFVGQYSNGITLVGAGAPEGWVYALDAHGNTLNSFNTGFPGGTRTAAADVNGDGTADYIFGAGPGGPSVLKVMDGKTGAVLFSTTVFEPNFTGGIFVSAGDVNGDGKADIVVSPDEGGGPRVRIYDGADFWVVADFFGIDDSNFRGGARTAVGDLDGDGFGDVIVAAGFGGGPRIAGYGGAWLAQGAEPDKLFADFFAFEATLRNGVFVGAGDLNGDGFADLVLGGGPGGGPRVLALSGKDLLHGGRHQIANFFAGDPQNRGGIPVTVKDLDGDRFDDIVVGSGEHAPARVTAYRSADIAANGTPAEKWWRDDLLPGFNGGVYVG